MSSLSGRICNNMNLLRQSGKPETQNTYVYIETQLFSPEIHIELHRNINDNRPLTDQFRVHQLN